MTPPPNYLSYSSFIASLIKIGFQAFGGSATTAALMEQFIGDRLSKQQIHAAYAYALILPGASQVAIVSNVGYRLKGRWGAVVATICYLLPSLSLITAFAAVYFGFTSGTHVTTHLSGVLAALAGIMLSNSQRVGKSNATSRWMWGPVVCAFGASFLLHINATLILLCTGTAAMSIYLLVNKSSIRE